MNAVLYTMVDYPYANHIRGLLTSNGINFYESIIGVDVFMEEISLLFPGYSQQAVVSIDGELIGGYNDLREWLDARPQLLID